MSGISSGQTLHLRKELWRGGGTEGTFPRLRRGVCTSRGGGELDRLTEDQCRKKRVIQGDMTGIGRVSFRSLGFVLNSWRSH